MRSLEGTDLGACVSIDSVSANFSPLESSYALRLADENDLIGILLLAGCIDVVALESTVKREKVLIEDSQHANEAEATREGPIPLPHPSESSCGKLRTHALERLTPTIRQRKVDPFPDGMYMCRYQTD